MILKLAALKIWRNQIQAAIVICELFAFYAPKYWPFMRVNSVSHFEKKILKTLAK